MTTNALWCSSLVLAWMLGQAVAPAVGGPMELTIDAAKSRVVINVGKSGLFGFAGHDHEVVAPAVQGRVSVDPADWQRSSVVLQFDAGALRVTGKGDPPSDVPKVQSVMLSEQVLDAQRFPTVAFRSRRVVVNSRGTTTADLQIEGDVTVHGVTRPLTVRASTALDASGALTARGAFTLKQTDFGIVPVTAAGGTVRAKDVVDVQFLLEAHR